MELKSASFSMKGISNYMAKNQNVNKKTDSFPSDYEEIDHGENIEDIGQFDTNEIKSLEDKINDLEKEKLEIQEELVKLKSERSELTSEIDKLNSSNANNNVVLNYKRVNEYDEKSVKQAQKSILDSKIHDCLDRLGQISNEELEITKEINKRKYLTFSKNLTEEELSEFAKLAMYAPWLFNAEAMNYKKYNGYEWNYDYNGYDSYDELIETLEKTGYTIEDINESLPYDEQIDWSKVESALSKGVTNLDIAMAFDLKGDNARNIFYPDSTVIEFIQKIEYMNDAEIEEAYTIYTNQGLEKFKEYLEGKRGEISKREGMIKALQYTVTIDFDDPNYRDYIKTHFKGLEDGLDQFWHGMEVFLSSSLSSEMTADQYEAMYIAALLGETNANVDGIFGEWNALQKVYTLSMSEGNMLPSMVAGTLGSVFGLQGLGAFTMFCSVTGNSAESAYQQGYDEYSALLYGSLCGASEAGLEYLLGGIPGLSKIADKSFLVKIFSEGVEESLQEVIDPFLRNAVLGEPLVIDLQKVLEAGIDGMILAAYLNGGEVIIGSTTVGAEALDFLQNNYQHFHKNKTTVNEIAEVLAYIEGQKLYETINEIQAKGIEIDYSRITEDGYLEGLLTGQKSVSLDDSSGIGYNKTDISKSLNDESLNSNADYVEEAALFGNKENFVSKLFGGVKFSSTNIELSVQERSLSNQINDYISQYGSAMVTFNNTTEFSTELLRSIKDLSALQVRINGGFNDINGNFRSKYNNAKYMERITYTGYEALAISEKLDELTSMIDMNLPTAERAKQIYEILSSEVPVMHDFENYVDGHKVSASLRGLTDVNNVGKPGLVCAGYSQAYKELCTRCGIQCDYVRGIGYGDVLRQGNSGGHAWNIVIDGNSIIPVDVTWKACGSENWFGGSDAFVARHVADSDEMFKDYSAPKTAFESISEALGNHDLKYGNGTGLRQLELYLQDGNITHITSFGGTRETIRNISLDQLGEYVKTQRAIQDIEYVMNVMTQKYGSSEALERMKAYVNPSSINYDKLSVFTRTGNCRIIMQHIDLSYIQQYIGVGENNGTNK